MRRFALAVIAVLGLLAVPVTAAHADPSSAPTVPVPSAVPGQQICTVDSTIYGITGMVATADGYAVVSNNKNTGLTQMYLLNNSCQKNGTIRYTGSAAGQARDPRDLALAPDGSAFWVADTGDDLTHPNRPTIAVWKLPTNKSTGSIYRFVYPQGDGPYSSDAMLLNGDGTPIFITRAASGPSGIYVPSAALDSKNNVPLKKVGAFTPQDTGTDNKLGPVGRTAVTGAANSPDGKHVTIRTLSDAYEWSVADGDVVKAITTTKPVITPLPSEPNGEAIAYSHDGKTFLTVSNLDSGTKASVLSYTPAVPVSPTKPSGLAGTGGGTSSTANTQGWFSKLSLQQLTYLVGGVGLIGLLMVVGGVLGIRSARNRPRPVPSTRTRPSAADRWSDDQDPGVPAGPHAPVPDVRRPHDADRYEPEYPPGRGGYPQPGYPDAPGPGPRPAGPDPGYGGGQPPRGGRTYRGTPDSGRYEETARYDEPNRYEETARYDGGGYEGGGYSSGYDPYGPANGYRGGDQGGYPSVPAQPTARDTKDSSGIARSHRGRAPKSRGVAPSRGGYSEEHEGFDDLRRLSQED